MVNYRPAGLQSKTLSQETERGKKIYEADFHYSWHKLSCICVEYLSFFFFPEKLTTPRIRYAMMLKLRGLCLSFSVGFYMYETQPGCVLLDRQHSTVEVDSWLVS